MENIKNINYEKLYEIYIEKLQLRRQKMSIYQSNFHNKKRLQASNGEIIKYKKGFKGPKVKSMPTLKEVLPILIKQSQPRKRRTGMKQQTKKEIKDELTMMQTKYKKLLENNNEINMI